MRRIQKTSSSSRSLEVLSASTSCVHVVWNEHGRGAVRGDGRTSTWDGVGKCAMVGRSLPACTSGGRGIFERGRDAATLWWLRDKLDERMFKIGVGDLVNGHAERTCRLTALLM